MTMDPGPGNPMDSPEDDGYALVMPFVVTASHDGPYDDEAFVAGYEAGGIDAALGVIAAAGGSRLTRTVLTPLLPQLELIGMRHGFLRVTAELCEGTPQWSVVTFEHAQETELP
jgi:hypothetical protein